MTCLSRPLPSFERTEQSTFLQEKVLLGLHDYLLMLEEKICRFRAARQSRYPVRSSELYSEDTLLKCLAVYQVLKCLAVYQGELRLGTLFGPEQAKYF